MASPKLAVILGAGASANVCPTPVCVKNEDDHPPLVSNLLTSPPSRRNVVSTSRESASQAC